MCITAISELLLYLCTFGWVDKDKENQKISWDESVTDRIFSHSPYIQQVPYENTEQFSPLLSIEPLLLSSPPHSNSHLIAQRRAAANQPERELSSSSSDSDTVVRCCVFTKPGVQL